MRESKSRALPLGYTPMETDSFYHSFLCLSRIFIAIRGRARPGRIRSTFFLFYFFFSPDVMRKVASVMTIMSVKNASR